MIALLALSTTLAALLGGPALDNLPEATYQAAAVTVDRPPTTTPRWHPAGDQMPVEDLAASTAHPYWTIPRWELAVWARIAQCESGGNPRAVNPSGRFRGEYQFWQVSWEAVGGEGDPIDAAHEEQTWRAHLLRLEQGWGAWPECSVVAGVRR